MFENQCLVMNRGISASGKSTWARKMEQKYNVIRVSKDDIRAKLLNGKWNYKKERSVVIPERDRLIREYLSEGYSVISDDTNFHSKHETILRGIALEFGVEFIIKDHWVDLGEAIKRDAQRENHVGESVIRRQWEQWVRPNLPKCITENGLSAVICDLDGTLALMTNRNPYEPKKCLSDEVNWQVKELLNFYDNTGRAIILMSGRTDDSMAETEQWLWDNNIYYDELWMRQTGDQRKDSIVKKEMYLEYVYPKYKVEVVLDDRQQVVDMWRDLGLTVFQVADGNF